MIALGPSDVETIDAISGDDEEIFNEEMVHSYKIMYEKLVETINENKRVLKQISQLSKEKNELIKQVNNLKSRMEDTQNELEQVKKTPRMLNSNTTALDQILMMGRTKGHEGLGFKEERSETKPLALINFFTIGRNYHHKGGRKNHSSRRQRLKCYYCKKVRHIWRKCSHLIHHKVRQWEQNQKRKKK